MDTNNKQNQTPQSEPEQAAEQPSAEKGAATSIFDELDTQYQHKQKAPGQVQNRYAWYAVVTAVVCAVAVTAAVLVNHFRKPDPAQDPSNGDGTSSVVSQAEEEQKLVLDESIPTTATGETDADKVKAIYVTNPSDTFTIETYLGKESTLDPNTAQYIEVDTMMWNITEVAGKDIDGVKFNSSTLGFLTGDFLKLAYTSVYAENGNATIPNGSMTYFQECGLDKATTHLTVVYNDGVTKSIAVGNPTPNGTGYFVAYTYPENEVSINDKIYVVSKESVVFLLKDATYFVDSNIVEAVPQGEDTYTEDGQMVEDPYFIMLLNADFAPLLNRFRMDNAMYCRQAAWLPSPQRTHPAPTASATSLSWSESPIRTNSRSLPAFAARMRETSSLARSVFESPSRLSTP